MTEIDIISFVATAEILAKYRSKDTHLDRLLKNLSVDPDSWKSYTEIRISSLDKAPHYEQIKRKHLKAVQLRIPDGESRRRTEAELISIINYCSAHPDADIRFVTLNSPKHRYVVFCGQVGDQRDAISVGIRKPNPEYTLSTDSSVVEQRQ